MKKKMVGALMIVVLAVIAGTYAKTYAQNNQGSVNSQVQTTKQVDLYVTSWCPWCRKMISFLDQKGITYTKHDVEREPGAQEVLDKRGVRGIPIVIIGDEVIEGYDPDAVMKALK